MCTKHIILVYNNFGCFNNSDSVSVVYCDPTVGFNIDLDGAANLYVTNYLSGYDINWINNRAVMWIIIDKCKSTRLVDFVKQRDPIKHRQHKTGQCIRHKHFTRGYHICPLIKGFKDGCKSWSPWLYCKHQ